VVAIGFAAHRLLGPPAAPPFQAGPRPANAVAAPRTADLVQDGAVLQSTGTVTRILPDDNDGSRHQRFILRLDSGRTVLVAHNIDLAPRVEGLAVGDSVEFKGEFVANAQGGVVHWTHRDPQGRHVDGWLRRHGRDYR
jgi:Protein of unknown function (DUF3465)